MMPIVFILLIRLVKSPKNGLIIITMQELMTQIVVCHQENITKCIQKNKNTTIGLQCDSAKSRLQYTQ